MATMACRSSAKDGKKDNVIKVSKGIKDGFCPHPTQKKKHDF